MDNKTLAKGQSPLYTKTSLAKQKAEQVKRLGPDLDGAYRYTRRLDERDGDKGHADER